MRSHAQLANHLLVPLLGWVFKKLLDLHALFVVLLLQLLLVDLNVRPQSEQDGFEAEYNGTNHEALHDEAEEILPAYEDADGVVPQVFVSAVPCRHVDILHYIVLLPQVGFKRLYLRNFDLQL